ncbi:hypothetical protein NDU88_003199 [Pleurodeles waltl]|uniref:Uncharacterized protein n=1 Tax=Pleurodeles waltl TaxID=8319 RepID=A0AAV7T4V5_PLEWA|nr:hypothetical protein NDU88_003199 [Pleurodeles waltl]
MVCDGPAGTSPHTRPTCADVACGVQEHHGASAERDVEENDEERDGDEERRDSGKEEREGDEEEKRGQSNPEPGEWLLPNRGIEDHEAAGGGLQTVVTLGGGMQNPARLLEEHGIVRCVTTPY